MNTQTAHSLPSLDARHGGPFDRGSADNYYGRAYDPHYWTNGTGKGLRIGAAGMDADELAAYAAGWADNETSGAQKEWA
jgi:hypothetical protein